MSTCCNQRSCVAHLHLLRRMEIEWKFASEANPCLQQERQLMRELTAAPVYIDRIKPTPGTSQQAYLMSNNVRRLRLWVACD